jgi:hypothetical protein
MVNNQTPDISTTDDDLQSVHLDSINEKLITNREPFDWYFDLSFLCCICAWTHDD